MKSVSDKAILHISAGAVDGAGLKKRQRRQSMNQAELAAYHAKHEREREREQMTRTHKCAVCGNLLVTPYSPETGETILVCGTDRTHQGIVKQKGVMQRWLEGEPMPIEIANKLEKLEKKERKGK